MRATAPSCILLLLLASWAHEGRSYSLVCGMSPFGQNSRIPHQAPMGLEVRPNQPKPIKFASTRNRSGLHLKEWSPPICGTQSWYLEQIATAWSNMRETVVLTDLTQLRCAKEFHKILLKREDRQTCFSFHVRAATNLLKVCLLFILCMLTKSQIGLAAFVAQPKSQPPDFHSGNSVLSTYHKLSWKQDCW